MTRMWIITCDRCGAEAQPAQRADEVRRLARNDGWHLAAKNRDRRDLCPACWAQPIVPHRHEAQPAPA